MSHTQRPDKLIYDAHGRSPRLSWQIITKHNEFEVCAVRKTDTGHEAKYYFQRQGRRPGETGGPVYLNLDKYPKVLEEICAGRLKEIWVWNGSSAPKPAPHPVPPPRGGWFGKK
jgi:hypothetical protein